MRWGSRTPARPRGLVLLGLVAALFVGACVAPAEAPRTQVRDLEGRPIDPLAVGDAHATVLLFVDPECPISNAYAPEVRRLYDEFTPRGVDFWLVYADAGRTPDVVRAHVAAFQYPMPAVRDADHELVRRAGATITPEACVFTARGELAYRGRIDDRYVDFGKQRAAPTTRDLRDAIEATLDGERPLRPWPEAIGCTIP